MSDTELMTVVRTQSVMAASTSEGRERASPPQDIESEPTNGGGTEQELAPVDGGSAAWRLLFAAYMFETLLWGIFLVLNLKISDADRVCRVPPLFWCLSSILLQHSRIRQ